MQVGRQRPDALSAVNRRPVSSSNIASVGWEQGVMEVEFTSGKTYRYEDVPEGEYQALLGADSPGKYLLADTHRRDLFPLAHMTDDLIAQEIPRAEEFDAARFEAFCAKLKIDTKELGRVPLTFLGSQRYLVEQIADGLSRGIHTFVILKGRQMGISTVLLALDLYWMFKNEGLKGAVVTDTDDNRELFRSYIEQYKNSLPPAANAPIERHNRVQLLLENNSRLVYMVAGLKKKGDLGRAKDVNYMHATEVSSWGDEEGFASLMNTLAQKNPRRLYIFESTARSYNAFYAAWEVAKESKTQMAIFIGWWRNEFYQWPVGSIEYETYWDGELTSDERVWVAEVFKLYAIEITPEQIAWWRWYCTEAMKGDENAMALAGVPADRGLRLSALGHQVLLLRAHQSSLSARGAGGVSLLPLHLRHELRGHRVS